jgi:hypothetical protein
MFLRRSSGEPLVCQDKLVHRLAYSDDVGWGDLVNDFASWRNRVVRKRTNGIVIAQLTHAKRS